MITQFKLFEEINLGPATPDNRPQIGDYVICELSLTHFPEYRTFVSSHILKVVDYDPTYDRDYKFYCSQDDYDTENKDERINATRINNGRNYIEEVKYWSKNKKELEPLLMAMKYNL